MGIGATMDYGVKHQPTSTTPPPQSDPKVQASAQQTTAAVRSGNTTEAINQMNATMHDPNLTQQQKDEYVAALVVAVPNFLADNTGPAQGSELAHQIAHSVARDAQSGALSEDDLLNLVKSGSGSPTDGGRELLSEIHDGGLLNRLSGRLTDEAKLGGVDTSNGNDAYLLNAAVDLGLQANANHGWTSGLNDAARTIAQGGEPLMRQISDLNDRYHEQGVFHPGGTDTLVGMFDTVAGQADGKTLATLTTSLENIAGGGEDGYALVDHLAGSVAARGTPAAKLDYVKALRDQTTDDKPIMSSSVGASYTHQVDPEALAVGKVIGSMRGKDAEAALSQLNQGQLDAVLKTGIDEKDQFAEGGASAAAFNPEGYTAIMAAAASTGDPNLKVRVFSAAANQMRTIREDGLPHPELAAVRDGMTTLLDSDTDGMISNMAFNEATLNGEDLSLYTQTMLEGGQTEKLGEQLLKLKLGNDLKGDARERFNEVTDVRGEPQYVHASALGYYCGSVKAGAHNIAQDEEGDKEFVTNVLQSVLTIFDKTGLAAKGAKDLVSGMSSVAKDWVESGINYALGQKGDADDQFRNAAYPFENGTLVARAESRSAFNAAYDDAAG